jgi:hypothetical protein
VRLRSHFTGRVGAMQDWLERRAETKVGRLSLQWFRAYFDASRNSGSAATVYSFLSAVPVMLALIALFDHAGGDANAFASRLIDHQRLSGS